MIIKEAIYKKKRVTKLVRIEDEINGCDCCQKEIKSGESLKLDIFYDNKRDIDTDHKDFCSWECLLKELPKIECDSFINLPFLHYDKYSIGSPVSAKPLLDLLSNLKL
jgi:hypothetical protein